MSTYCGFIELYMLLHFLNFRKYNMFVFSKEQRNNKSRKKGGKHLTNMTQSSNIPVLTPFNGMQMSTQSCYLD